MKTTISFALIALSIAFGGNANAAFLASDCSNIAGYHMVYDNLCMGFGEFMTQNGTHFLAMSTDPAPHALPSTEPYAMVYSYQDVQNGASGLKWTAAQYNEMAYLVQNYPAMYTPDSQVPAWAKGIAAANMNIAIANIAVPGSVPFPDASSPIYNGNQAQLIYNQALGIPNFNWTYLGMQIVSIPGSDEYFSDQTVAPTLAATPIPPAVWLFVSGLIGLVGVSRRKAFRT